MNLTLILRNGQRIPVPNVDARELFELLLLGFAGYILKPASLDITKLK